MNPLLCTSRAHELTVVQPWRSKIDPQLQQDTVRGARARRRDTHREQEQRNEMADQGQQPAQQQPAVQQQPPQLPNAQMEPTAFAAPVAAAVQQALQAIPALQAQPALTFAVHPAGAADQPWDFTKGDGLKLFLNSTKGLDTKCDGDQAKLNQFLQAVCERAESFGWMAILQIPVPAGGNHNEQLWRDL